MLTQGLVLLVAVMTAMGYSHLSKAQAARQISLNLRNNLISGEFRDAIIVASAAVPNSFTEILFEKNDGVIVFRVPQGAAAYHNQDFRYWEEVVELHFTVNPSESPAFGRLVFVANRFELVGKAFLIWLFFLIASIPVYGMAYRYLQRKYAFEIEAKKAQAIAQTTQMLAHDVRKPFSTLKLGVTMLSESRNFDEVQSIIKILAPEVTKAIASVDGLISDVMEIGAPASNLSKSAVSVKTLIQSCLDDVFRTYPHSKVELSYDFQHRSFVDGDQRKLGRAFSNIVGNAIQAINYSGSIWFRTVERDGIVEFCIGNAGSFVPKEKRAAIFDAFFSSGKEGGTGLGLAIAKKVVLDHEGVIWCESRITPEDPEGVVEFKFTVPAAPILDMSDPARLPKDSSSLGLARFQNH